MSENIKNGIRSWLNIQPASPYTISIRESLDFEANAIRNRIWYRGDSNELEQLYESNEVEYADRFKFWASKSSPGMEMRKIHTGLPGLMVRILTTIVLRDMNEFEFPDSGQHKELWDNIAKENDFHKKLEKAVKETLVIGDGAFKVTINTAVSPYPIIEWYAGDRIDIVTNCGRLTEIIFKTPYRGKGNIRYMLHEHYGKGYIHYELFMNDKAVDLSALQETAGLTDWRFDPSVLLAVPLQVYESTKYDGRGGSIFDGKLDSFDAFDEAWSQWMDALRAGRARVYTPESYIPRDPYTGKPMSPNPFDNRFIMGDDDMSEGASNKISIEQPTIPHDSYLSSYVTALDLCLQGIISPSTLGIDNKKLDNAEAQREKEKTTLYTRNAIIEALQHTLPTLVEDCINAYAILNKQALKPVEVNVPFGEYANPSFESQVETIGKARTQGIMSIERCVEELYGDSLDSDCKDEEVARLKAEQGIEELTEPSLSMSAGDFRVEEKNEPTEPLNGQNGKEGETDDGTGSETHLQNEPGEVPGAPKDSK